MTTVSTQQVLSQAMVGAMAVNIVATSMFAMMAAVGPEAFKVPPAELKGTEAAVRELRLTFGASVVDRAVKNVGVDNMLALAMEVERLIVEDMEKQYGAQATQAALLAAPLGDIATAYSIANMLTGRGVKPADFQKTLATPVGAQVVEGAKKRTKMKAKPVLDTKTNIQYKSKSSAGMAVAAEYGLDEKNTFVWYEVIKKDATRFKEI